MTGAIKVAFPGVSRGAWISAVLLFFVPLLPGFIAPFLIAVPFFAALCEQGARQRMFSFFRRVNGLVLCTGLFVAAAFLGIAFASDKVYALCTCLMWLWCLLGFLGLSCCVRGASELRLCLAALACSGGLSALPGIMQHMGRTFGFSFPNPFWGGLERAVLERVPILHFNIEFDGLHRSCSTFLNSGVYAGFLVLVIPLAVYLAYTAVSRKEKLAYWAVCALCVASLAFTFSRTCYIGFILSATVILIGRKVLRPAATINRRRPPLSTGRKLLVGAIILCCVCVGCVLFFQTDVADRFFSIFSSDSSKSARFALWRASGELIAEKPFFGYGTGMDNQWILFKTLYGIDLPHAHNTFLQLWLEGGVVRIAPFIGMIVCYCVTAVRLMRSKSGAFPMLGICLVASMTAMLTESTTNFIFVDPKLCFLFFALAACCVCAAKIYADEKQKGMGQTKTQSETGTKCVR